jgi:hypothetical protein
VPEFTIPQATDQLGGKMSRRGTHIPIGGKLKYGYPDDAVFCGQRGDNKHEAHKVMTINPDRGAKWSSNFGVQASQGI